MEWVFARWVTLTATILAIGAVTVFVALLPRITDETSWVQGARRSVLGIALGASAALVPAALLRLTDQVLALDTGSALAAWQHAPALLLHTTWGTGFLSHLVAIAVMAAAALFARRTATPGGVASGALLLGALALGLSPSLQGHAIAVEDRALLAVLSDTVHVLGGGIWLGGLAVIGWLGLAVRRADGSIVTESLFVADLRLRTLVPLVPPVALTGAALLLGSGITSSLLHLRAVDDLWGSEWGRYVLLKSLLLALAMGLGAVNWRRRARGLSEETGPERLRQTLAIELAAAALALVVTSLLIITPPPGE